MEGDPLVRFAAEVKQQKELSLSKWRSLSFSELRSDKHKETFWELLNAGIDVAQHSKVPFRLGKAEALIREWFVGKNFSEFTRAH